MGNYNFFVRGKRWAKFFINYCGERLRGLDFSMLYVSDLQKNTDEYHGYSMTDADDMKRMLRAVPVDPSRSAFFDVGCGRVGTQLAGMCMKCASELGYHTVAGLDLDEHLLGIARRNMARLKLNADCIQANAVEFDGYAAYDVFYFYNPFGKSVFQQVIRKLLESQLNVTGRFGWYTITLSMGNCSNRPDSGWQMKKRPHTGYGCPVLPSSKKGGRPVMKKGFVCLLGMLLCLTGCQAAPGQPTMEQLSLSQTIASTAGNMDEPEDTVTPGIKVTQLEDGLSTVCFEGDSGFDGFLEQGGVASDQEVAQYLTRLAKENISLGDLLFGCSTISVANANGGYLLGRNFDWEPCNAMIVQSASENGYKSISTVNTDFITMSGVDLSQLPDKYQALICLYAPLDGMNEKGLVVSVNMIQDSATIAQNSGKPGLTTTTAIRLLLDKAATVDEALGLLEQYDMHASMGYMMHLAIADNTGRSVVVEYINNEMAVAETPVVTNFYLVEGVKNGIGTAQSHERYDILMDALAVRDTMTTDEVRDALDSVSKDNFNEFESTEWSVVFDLGDLTARYYHRENYDKKYVFMVG